MSATASQATRAVAPAGVAKQAAARRTFAIISHPDAGKTTLTEQLLFHTDAVAEAGQVKARRGRRSTTSDWTALERQRGISVSSTLLRFESGQTVFNLLDTPGHRDFSEDTLRVLAAADSAVLLLDAAKGVEPQTLRLFQVARERGIPLLTFVNKYDRPGLEPLALLDDIEQQLGLRATPVTWPVGIAGDCTGVVDRRDGSFHRFQRALRGAGEPAAGRAGVPGETDEAWHRAEDEMALLDAVGARLDLRSFRTGESTPVFFGSALSGFGVPALLNALVELAPAPGPRVDREGAQRPLDAAFSGFVFKVQANLDPQHRDRIAFVRVCSGRFERGMRAVHARTGRPFAMNYAHELFGQRRQTLEEAYPGDVVGVVNALDLRVGDSLYVGEPVRYPGLATLTPEHFVTVRNGDTGRYKQFRRGLAQLEEEGVVQVLRHPQWGDQAPVLAGVGPMQFEVAVHRLEHEFGAAPALSPAPYAVARRTDDDGERAVRRWRHGEVLHRADGTRLAVFASQLQLDHFTREHPQVTVERFLVG